ncbi:hypothetical protein LR48_Vigan432s002700 [Vigna angularis]|uniref:GRF-type domain-containing protein n=1 Tax=Phaseolus angularis TaxID=3914 RepID=A0A0L9TAH3_PHAAN|nr:hypothetical protein LR48_Vigan432s002700 [Vigna angularis]
MSKEHSWYSSSCSARRKENGTPSPICYCGQSCVVRTAKTTKNRGKQFWGCSKYKNGGEESGCNFFEWCNDIGGDERGSLFNSEGKKETLVKSQDMDNSFSFNVDDERMIPCNFVVGLRSSNYVLAGRAFVVVVFPCVAVVQLREKWELLLKLQGGFGGAFGRVEEWLEVLGKRRSKELLKLEGDQTLWKRVRPIWLQIGRSSKFSSVRPIWFQIGRLSTIARNVCPFMVFRLAFVQFVKNWTFVQVTEPFVLGLSVRPKKWCVERSSKEREKRKKVWCLAPVVSTAMRIVRRDIVPNGPGSVKMVAVDSDDLWFAYNLILAGDSVMAVTVRRRGIALFEEERFKLEFSLKLKVKTSKGGGLEVSRVKNFLQGEEMVAVDSDDLWFAYNLILGSGVGLAVTVSEPDKDWPCSYVSPLLMENQGSRSSG